MTDTRTSLNRFILPAFGVVLLVAWLCYQPALHGDFRLDDRSNLSGLAQVTDRASAIDFVLGGDAGPTGRPLALATFALQAESWADGPSAFLAVNVALHLLNAALLCLCLLQLARFRGMDPERALVAAVIAASAWVLLPLLASATMLVVQRMTTLSATFVLLGLAGYLLARTRLESRPVLAYAGMSASLAIGTLLAALCKESGLLLPLFALVIEATILRSPETAGRHYFRYWQVIVLGLPAGVLLYYLATIPPYSESLELRRGFSAGERLLTEARVLWLYVHKALVGLPGRLGIYQTPPEISRSLFEPLTFVASVGWIALAGSAIAFRRRWPLFAFAVLWFLAAHLIESTVVPLEIYFEHRNYLAVAGPLFAIAAAVVDAPPKARHVGYAGLGLFSVANAFMLFTFASIWGDPSASSRYWAMRYPDSVRAVTTMAQYQLAEQPPIETLRTLDAFVSANPEHAYLRIQELNLRCRVLAGQDHSGVIQELERQLPNAGFTFTAGTMLSQLLDTVAGGGCNGVDTATVTSLAETLSRNPRYAGDASWRQFHQRLLAAVARYEGDIDRALEQVRQAIAIRPSSELNMMMVTGLAAIGDFDAALDFIEDARNRAPKNVVRALRWQRNLDSLEAYILELRAAESP